MSVMRHNIIWSLLNEWVLANKPASFIPDQAIDSYLCLRLTLVFDIYVTEYGTALTTILPILFLYLNTVTVTAGTFEL
jgi:hypothetical protein